MKEVAFAFLANSADLLMDGRLIVIGADIDGFMCPQMPIGVQLSFVAKLIFAADEVSASHTIAIEYTKPDGTRTPLATTVPLALRLNPGNPAADAKAAVVVAIAMNFDAPGLYSFHAMVDEQEVVSRPLNIVLLPPGTISTPMTGSTPCPQQPPQSL